MNLIRSELLPSLLALSAYDITDNGFLPAEPPLAKLSNQYYDPWEHILDQLPELLVSMQLRTAVDQMPVLSTSFLIGRSEHRRGYLVLAFLSQAYIWQGPSPSQRLPPAIAVPLLDLASRLKVPPVATYSALNLWNWKPTSDGADIREPESLQALHTFTRTEDESWFYMISSAMEARAGPLMKTMLMAIAAVHRDDPDEVIGCLQKCQEYLSAFRVLLRRMDDRCDPQRFYHTIRPYLAGTVNMETTGLPQGVFFDEGDGKGSWWKYRGGSNGQSSLIQFLDVVLGVNHSGSSAFHQEMRNYMPGPHARFLADVETISDIRACILHHRENARLNEAYNAAVAGLSEFRNVHIQLVTRYIVLPSRAVDKIRRMSSSRMDLASSTDRIAANGACSSELVGTGGTKFIPFLQKSRDETSAAVVVRS